MSDANVFGPIADGSDVEAALLAHLQEWIDTYLGFMVRHRDPDGAAWPRSEDKPFGVAEIADYRVVHMADEKWPEDHLPMFLAYSRGLAEPAKIEGDGTISGRYICILTAIASGIDLEDTKALARLYAGAARLAVMQHPDLGGVANGVEWVDHTNYAITKGVDAERNLMGVSDTFLIGIDELLNREAGVPEPLDTPMTAPDDWPIIGEGKATAEVTIEED